MLFSTKAEYGIRLMVALGRRGGEAPVALATLANAETLPASYLEHLVAKLRAAGLVTSQRGAHGGYRLAKPASEIRMLEVVEALEGRIAPMDCFTPDDEVAVAASTVAQGWRRGLLDQALWTVQSGITGPWPARRGPTVEFGRRTVPPDGTNETGVTSIADLGDKNLHVSAEEKSILKASTSR